MMSSFSISRACVSIRTASRGKACGSRCRRTAGRYSAWSDAPYRYPAEFIVARTTKQRTNTECVIFGIQHSAFSIRLAFVSGGSVDRRQRHVEKAQVDAELSPVMDQVIHDEAAKHGLPRQREDLVPALLQRPRRRERGVGLRVDLRASLLDVLIERLQQAGRRFRHARARIVGRL